MDVRSMGGGGFIEHFPNVEHWVKVRQMSTKKIRYPFYFAKIGLIVNKECGLTLHARLLFLSGTLFFRYFINCRKIGTECPAHRWLAMTNDILSMLFHNCP